MAKDYLDDLAKELIDIGIMTAATQKASGVWSGTIDPERIYNRDETPQFVNYGVNGRADGLVYCGKGEYGMKQINPLFS